MQPQSPTTRGPATAAAAVLLLAVLGRLATADEAPTEATPGGSRIADPGSQGPPGAPSEIGNPTSAILFLIRHPSSLIPHGYLDRYRRAADKLRRAEIVEMFSSMAAGSGLGPGSAWFHAGQSRYGWHWLAERCDADGDGTVWREEFCGPSQSFDRLDRNHDDQLTEKDFDWSESAEYQKQWGLMRRVFRPLDRDSNGRIAHEEWEDFFRQATQNGRSLTPDDLHAALFPPEPPGDDDGPSPLVFIAGLLTGELGSVHEGPAIGQPAPDFALPVHGDEGRTLGPAQFRGSKPVVLIFGSFT